MNDTATQLPAKQSTTNCTVRRADGATLRARFIGLHHDNDDSVSAVVAVDGSGMMLEILHPSWVTMD